MSWSLVQAVKGASSTFSQATTVNATFGSAVTVGNLIFVACRIYTQTSLTIGDTVNSYSGGTSTIAGSGDGEGNVAYGWTQATTAAALTVTLTVPGAAYLDIAIAEFSIAPGTTWLHGTDSAVSGTSVTSISTNVAIVGGNNLVLGISAWTGATPFTPGGGFTIGYQAIYPFAFEYALNQTTSPVATSIGNGTVGAGTLLGVPFQEVLTAGSGNGTVASSSTALAVGAPLGMAAGTDVGSSAATAVGLGIGSVGTIGTAAGSSTASGGGSVAPPNSLFIPYALRSVTIFPVVTAETPWTIDPERTQRF